MAGNKTKKEEVEVLDPRVYEVGYHILPTVSEGDVSSAVSSVRGIIEKAGGTIILEEEPKMITLAYSMVRVIANKNHSFDSAYFGWMKFELEPSLLEGVNNELKLNDNVLRFLTISTTKEAPVVASMIASEEKKEKVEEKPKAAKKDEKTKEEVASDKALDKTIDELVIE